MKIKELIKKEHRKITASERSKQIEKRNNNDKLQNTLYENSINRKLYIKQLGDVHLVETARVGKHIDKKA